MTTYYRFTHNPNSPMSEWGHAMFADSLDKVSGHAQYGPYCWIFEDNRGGVVGAEKLQKYLASEIEKYIDKGGCQFDCDGWFDTWMDQISNGEFTVEQLAESCNPANIVDSASAYDNPTMLQIIYRIMERNNWVAITTCDGAIVFDQNLITRNEKGDW